MRDLLFKNLTSGDRRRKIVASCEVAQNRGIRSIIRRHLVCVAKEIKNADEERPAPYVYVLRERNTKEQKEKFFFRIKGSVIAASGDRLFLISFAHSLKISLNAVAHSAVA